MLEADEIAEAAEDAEVTVEDGRNEVGSKRQSLLRMDPCMDKHCGAGRVCKVCQRPKSHVITTMRTILQRFFCIFAITQIIVHRVCSAFNYSIL